MPVGSCCARGGQRWPASASLIPSRSGAGGQVAPERSSTATRRQLPAWLLTARPPFPADETVAMNAGTEINEAKRTLETPNYGPGTLATAPQLRSAVQSAPRFRVSAGGRTPSGAPQDRGRSGARRRTHPRGLPGAKYPAAPPNARLRAAHAANASCWFEGRSEGRGKV